MGWSDGGMVDGVVDEMKLSLTGPREEHKFLSVPGECCEDSA